jgi:hypothetical protein
VIENIQQGHEMFFSQFISNGDYANPLLVIPYKNTTLSIPVRFYKKSAKDRSEESTEVYPVISIQPIQPKILTEMFNAYDPDRAYDILDGQAHVSEVYPVPVQMQYQVSFASKDYTQDSAYNTWFFRKFLAKNAAALIYNPVTIPLNDNLGSTDIVGDYVGYTFESLNIIRESDGVFETAHMFTVGPVWMAMFDEVLKDVPETIAITLNQKG